MDKLKVKVHFDSMTDCFFANAPDIIGYECRWIARNLSDLVTTFTYYLIKD